MNKFDTESYRSLVAELSACTKAVNRAMDAVWGFHESLDDNFVDTKNDLKQANDCLRKSKLWLNTTLQDIRAEYDDTESDDFSESKRSRLESRIKHLERLIKID